MRERERRIGREQSVVKQFAALRFIFILFYFLFFFLGFSFYRKLEQRCKLLIFHSSAAQERIIIISASYFISFNLILIYF